MADVAELKSMVMTFRVSELQVLLGFTGRSKSGRKQELLQRALALVSRGCATPIQIKILELYKRRSPMRAPNVPHPVQPPAQPPPVPHGSHSAPFDYKPPAAPPQSSPPHLSVPIHPDVHFRRLPFYDVLGVLLKPSSLAPRHSSRFQETSHVFHLTPTEAQEIAMSSSDEQCGSATSDVRPGSIIYEYTVQIQLRFCLLETSCSQEDNFPPSICVRVNGKMASLPNPIPTNKPGVEPKRPSRPVNITPICRISPTVANQIQISWASELGRNYCVAVYLVRKLTSDILLTRLKGFGVRHPDHTRALIKEKLAHDPDSEIATTSLRVSLMCPLGKMRMTFPTRSSTCRHLQCFDSPTFLQMNERKPTWTCPVCDKPTEFDNLAIDGLFTELLEKSQDANEIEFFEDGSWQPMKRKENESSGGSHAIHTIGDSPKKENGEKGTDVIDLTETDDEEEPDVPMISCADSSSSSASSSSSTSGDSISSVTVVPTSSATHEPTTHSSQGCLSDSNSSSSFDIALRTRKCKRVLSDDSSRDGLQSPALSTTGSTSACIPSASPPPVSRVTSPLPPLPVPPPGVSDRCTPDISDFALFSYLTSKSQPERRSSRYSLRSSISSFSFLDSILEPATNSSSHPHDDSDDDSDVMEDDRHRRSPWPPARSPPRSAPGSPPGTPPRLPECFAQLLPPLSPRLQIAESPVHQASTSYPPLGAVSSPTLSVSSNSSWGSTLEPPRKTQRSQSPDCISLE